MFKKILCLLLLLMTPAVYSSVAQEHFSTVNNVKLHYLEQGKGHLVILLHGWPETSYEWRSTIGALAKHYRVVAPDLRGLGLSEKTATGYDKQTIAQDIKSLIEHLGEKQAMVIGHDMGGKVAYVMAHVYPQMIKKLILVDCTIPGTENADALHGGGWHYGFHMATDIPEMLTKGREKEYLQAQISHWTFKKDAIDEQSIKEYAKHYASQGGMTAGFNYYRTLKEDAIFVDAFRGKQLAMPILTISGSNSVGNRLPDALKQEAPFLKRFIIHDCGHFVPEEKPELFNKLVLNFLKGKQDG